MKPTNKEVSDQLFAAISGYVKALLAKENEAAMNREAAQLQTLAALEARIAALEKEEAEMTWRKMSYDELRAETRERFAQKRAQVFIEVAAMLDKLEAEQLAALDALEQKLQNDAAPN